MEDNEQLIRLCFKHDVHCITVAEYDELKRVVLSRNMTGDLTILERLGASILLGSEHRYLELKRQQELQQQKVE